MRKGIVILFILLMFFPNLFSYAQQRIRYPSERFVIIDDTLTATSTGILEDTSASVNVWNSIGKSTIYMYTDTIAYCHGLFPRINLSYEPSDSVGIYAKFYHSQTRDTLITIPAPSVQYFARIDTLPLARSIRFYTTIDTVATDTSKYYIKIVLEKQ